MRNKIISFLKYKELSPKQHLVSCLVYFPIWGVVGTVYSGFVEAISKKNSRELESAPTAENANAETIESLCKTNKHNIQVTCWLRSFLAIIVLVASLFGTRKLSEYIGSKYNG